MFNKILPTTKLKFFIRLYSRREVVVPVSDQVQAPQKGGADGLMGPHQAP